MFVAEDKLDSSSLIPAANQTTTLGFSRLVDSEGEEGALLRSQYKLLDESQSAEESEKRKYVFSGVACKKYVFVVSGTQTIHLI